MQSYIDRDLANRVLYKLGRMQAVALLGPRQCGKTTLARHVVENIENSIYLDLERPSDLNKLDNAEVFFDANEDKLICLDEIQRVPELFPVLRGVIDRRGDAGQFLVLGSASRDLIRQSSETLAGRLSYLELGGFAVAEVCGKSDYSLWKLLGRGGFPKSYLAPNDIDSYEWRLDFIRSFLERDMPQLGFNIDARRMDRFWRMCAHVHGQTLNASKLGDSLGVSHHTIRSYLELLEQTFLVRLLLPFVGNLKKRLVKAPKVYIRDTGLLHALLRIRDTEELFGHPGFGSSWEGFIIENILVSISSDWEASYYRTSGGAEIDLILERGKRRVAIECKASKTPKATRGFYTSVSDLDIEESYLVAPVDTPYPSNHNIWVTNISDVISRLKQN